MRLPIPLLPMLAILCALAQGAGAQVAPWKGSGAGAACRPAIEAAEALQHIPDAFLGAIAKVESGRSIGGMVVAWPWAINAEGAGSFFATKEDAIAAVRALQARGVRSIDVGCMQVNLQQHPEAFQSLEQAFDPVANAHFAATLLNSLFVQTGSWPLAAAAYHSQTPTLGQAYQRQVLAAWAVPDRPAKTADHSPRPSQPPRKAAIQLSTPPASPPPGGIAAPGNAFGHQVAGLATQPARPPALHASGRGLADYRMIPTRLAFRLPAKSG